jgi:hypothetical protein
MRLPIIPKTSLGLFLLIAFASQSLMGEQRNSFSGEEFWVINGSTVQKIDGQGIILSSYHNHSLGTPTSIDVTDPFRIMVFYHQTQAIVVINTNGVALGKPVSINDLALGEVTLACRSSRGGVWLYHRESNELILTNPQLTHIVQRTRVNSTQDPTCLSEANNIIYLGINNTSILLIDSYGAKRNELNILHDGYFMVDADSLWVINNGLIEKRELLEPTKIIDFFMCTCNSNPLIFNGEAKCFDGHKLITCEKITGSGR